MTTEDHAQNPNWVFQLAHQEAAMARQENSNAAKLEATLASVAGTYIAVVIKLALATCAAGALRKSNSPCTFTPWYVYDLATFPILSIVGLILIFFSDFVQRDFYALEIEAHLFQIAGRPRTLTNLMPFPGLYRLSRRVWDDRNRPRHLIAVWYLTLATAFATFTGFGVFMLRLSLHTRGLTPWLFTAAVSSIWVYFLVIFTVRAIKAPEHWKQIPAWILEQMPAPTR